MEPMYYIGLDVHKRKISFCVKDSGGKVYAEGSISVACSFSRRTRKTVFGIWTAFHSLDK
jgi:hypothetical protein